MYPWPDGVAFCDVPGKMSSLSRIAGQPVRQPDTMTGYTTEGGNVKMIFIGSGYMVVIKI